jgi:hypothetical protein
MGELVMLRNISHRVEGNGATTMVAKWTVDRQKRIANTPEHTWVGTGMAPTIRANKQKAPTQPETTKNKTEVHQDTPTPK